jgi:cytoskeletal protein CcmA (bactofilin family)
MSRINLRNKKMLISLSLVALMVFGIVGTAYAAEFPTGETIPASQTVDDDVFLSGENVVVDGTVNGVLFAAGATVTVNGTINGDAFLAGETVIVSDSAVITGNLFTGAAEITVNGTVEGSVFGGSSSMTLSDAAKIARNMFYGGFSLTTAENSSIGRDLYLGAYQGLLSGVVERNLNAEVAALKLDGSVAGDAVVNLGEVAETEQSDEWVTYNPYISKYVETVLQPGLYVADSASIGGKATFISSVDESSQLAKITSGTVVYQTPVPGMTDQTGSRYGGDVHPFNRRYSDNFAWAKGFSVVQSLIKLFVLGALALWLLQKPFMKLVDAAYHEPMKSMGWGFVLIAVGVLAAFIVPLVFVMIGVLVGFLSLGSLLPFWFGLIGAALGLVFLAFFFAVFTVSKIVAAFMFGKWLMKVVFKQTEEKVWLDLLVGVFLFVVIRAIPFVGWLAGLAATLIGAGAFWLAWNNRKTVA